MTETHRAAVALVGALSLVTALTIPVRGQVGRGLIDPNVAAESDLGALPHMTPGGTPLAGIPVVPAPEAAAAAAHPAAPAAGA